MTDVIKSTPLAQLSEAGMCKTSRMVEAKLGGILKKGESKSPNFFRAYICRDIIQNALRYKIKKGKDVMEYMNGRYVEAGFINPQQKKQVLLDDWRKIMRYLREEKREPKFVKTGYPVLKDGELPIKVAPTVLFPVGDKVDIVLIKIGRPNVTKKGDKGKLARSLQLYAMIKYARMLGYKNITASFYFLTKSNDTNNWLTNDPLFFTGDSNIVSMSDLWDGTDTPNDLDKEMQPLIDLYYQGVDECIAEEHGQTCAYPELCRYKKAPIKVEVEEDE
jgi:ATP-dependent DNA helicase uvrD/REP family